MFLQPHLSLPARWCVATKRDGQVVSTPSGPGSWSWAPRVGGGSKGFTETVGTVACHRSRTITKLVRRNIADLEDRICRGLHRCLSSPARYMERIHGRCDFTRTVSGLSASTRSLVASFTTDISSELFDGTTTGGLTTDHRVRFRRRHGGTSGLAGIVSCLLTEKPFLVQ